jgi:transposase
LAAKNWRRRSVEDGKFHSFGSTDSGRKFCLAAIGRTGLDGGTERAVPDRNPSLLFFKPADAPDQHSGGLLMFPVLSSIRVYLATGATDMRKSINGLSVLVAEQLEMDPLSGHLFAFCNRKRDIVKILYYDRNGFALWMKRLEKDTYQWPETSAEAMPLGARELHWLLEGLSLVGQNAHRGQAFSTVV